MDDIKLFAKNEKELETNARNKNIQSGHRNGIRHRKMHHANNENYLFEIEQFLTLKLYLR